MNINKFNENKYNDNTNNLLLILLLLVFLKCDKAKQKRQLLLNALEEEKVKPYIEKDKIEMIIEDLETNSKPTIDLEEINEKDTGQLEEIDKEKSEDNLVKDIEVAANNFEKEKIKHSIEKDKIEVLIRDLETNAKPSIDLEEINEKDTEQLEELGKEKSEENFVKNIEVASNNFEKEKVKAYIEKDKIEVLIRDLETNAIPIIDVEELNEKSTEQFEQKKSEALDKEKSECKLTNASEPTLGTIKEEKIQIYMEKPKMEIYIKNLDSNAELNIKLKEANEQKLEPLEQNKSDEMYKEKLENQDLTQSHKKDQEDERSISKDFDRDSIVSMRIILKQLVGENIAFSTIAGSTEFIANATLMSVKDGIVNISVSDRILSIPICEIVGVESNLIHSIELQPLMDISSEESYEYKEWSLGNLFSSRIGEQIFIETKGSGSFNNITNKIVTNVGHGIVVLDNTMALSLSKIILVERR